MNIEPLYTRVLLPRRAGYAAKILARWHDDTARVVKPAQDIDNVVLNGSME